MEEIKEKAELKEVITDGLIRWELLEREHPGNILFLSKDKSPKNVKAKDKGYLLKASDSDVWQFEKI